MKWVLILSLLLCLPLALAANDPGHDTLYVLRVGDTDVTGSINLTSNFTAASIRYVTLLYGNQLNIRSNGTIIDPDTDNIPAIQSTTSNLYLDANTLLLSTLKANPLVQIGSSSDDATLNVSGTLRVATAGYIAGSQICTAGNGLCAATGGNGNISGQGTSGTLAKFTGTGTIGDSIVSESGSTLSVNGNIQFSTGGALQASGNGYLKLETVSNNGYLLLNSSDGIRIILRSNTEGMFEVTDPNGTVLQVTPRSHIMTLGHNTNNLANANFTIIGGGGVSNNVHGVNLYITTQNTTGAGRVGNIIIAPGWADGTGTNGSIQLGNIGAPTKVGIGTASPTQKLDVNGSANITDTLYVTTAGYIGNSQICTAANGLCASGVVSSAGGWQNTSNVVSLVNSANNVTTGGAQPLFFIDSTNDRVGVNLIPTTREFEVNGSMILRGSAPTAYTDYLRGSTTQSGFIQLSGSSVVGRIVAESGAYIPLVITTAQTQTANYVEVRLNTSSTLGDIFVINNTGNIGIGAARPTQKLDVNGSVNISGTSAKLYTPEVCIGADCRTSWPTTSSGGGWQNTSDVISLANNRTNVSIGNITGNNPLLFIDSTSGFIGIGNSTPAAKLHIQGVSSTKPGNLLFERVSTATDAMIQFSTQGTEIWELGARGDGTNNFRFYDPGASRTVVTIEDGSRNNSLFIANTNHQGIIGISTTDPTADLTINSSNPAGSLRIYSSSIEQVFVNGSSGNLGINTVLPLTKLHVNGSVTIAAPATTPTYVNISTGSANVDAQIIFGEVGSPRGFIGVVGADDNFLHISSGFNQNLLLQNGLTSGANNFVGISTNAPTQKLHVNGSVNISGTSAKLYAPEICLNGDCQTAWPSGGSSGGWTNTSTDVYLVDSNDNVGIGTSSPGAKLDISVTRSVSEIGSNATRIINYDNSNLTTGTGTKIGFMILQNTSGNMTGDSLTTYGARISNIGNDTPEREDAQFNGISVYGIDVTGGYTSGTTDGSDSFVVTGAKFAATGDLDPSSPAASQHFGIQTTASGTAIVNYGIFSTVSGAGQNYAFRGTATGTSGQTTTGVYAAAQGGTTNTAGSFTSSGTGDSNYGIYAIVNNAINNYGLYISAPTGIYSNNSYGIYIDTVASHYNNTALYIAQGAPLRGLNNYSIYSASNATSWFNGSINISDGSALHAPQICLNGNCQTSWPSGSGLDSTSSGWRNSSTTVFLNNNNTNVSVDTRVFYIDTANNVVGIGTSEPTRALEVNSSGASGVQAAFYSPSNVTGNNAGIEFALNNATDGRTVYADMLVFINDTAAASEDGIIAFRTKKAGTMTEQVRITHDGNVGIGTATPGSLLHLNSSTNGNVLLDIQNMNTGGSAQAVLQLTADSGNAHMLVGSAAGGDHLRIQSGSGLSGGMTLRTLAAADITFSPNDVAAMTVKSGGTVAIGTTVTTQKLTVNGSINASGPGNIYYEGNLTGYGADLAELVFGSNVEAGDVVILDPANDEAVIKSIIAYDTRVAGIVSTDPSHLMSADKGNVPLALAGRVPVKVSAENGMVQRGDLLTTSNTPGYAMKCISKTECAGAIVGKAMENMQGDKDMITALVVLG